MFGKYPGALCVGLQLSLSYKFHKNKNVLNPHYKNLENELTDLHFLKGPFKWDNMQKQGLLLGGLILILKILMSKISFYLFSTI